MNNFLRLLGITFLLMLIVVLGFVGYGFYTFSQLTKSLAPRVESYTCRDFRQQIERPEGPDFFAITTAMLAYGTQGHNVQQMEDDIRQHGVTPSISRLYRACEGKPQATLLQVLAVDVISGTQPLPQAQPSVSPAQTPPQTDALPTSILPATVKN